MMTGVLMQLIAGGPARSPGQAPNRVRVEQQGQGFRVHQLAGAAGEEQLARIRDT
jgi:hypothetical protein